MAVVQVVRHGRGGCGQPPERLERVRKPDDRRFGDVRGFDLALVQRVAEVAGPIDVLLVRKIQNRVAQELLLPPPQYVGQRR